MIAIPAGGTRNIKIPPITPGRNGAMYRLRNDVVFNFLMGIHSDFIDFLEIVCIFIHKTDKVDYNEFCKRF